MDGSFSENDILIVITMGIIMMMFLAMAFGLFFYFSQKKFQAQRMKAQQRELQHREQLLFSSIQAQEKERERIARELHDAVGSRLNVINLGLHQLHKAPDGKAVGAAAIQELFSVVGSTIETTRRISHDLLPPTLDSFGLHVALEELCESYQQASAIAIHYELCEDNRPLADKTVALSIFRVVQELMSNSFKYAEASQITVKLWQGAKAIRLTYQDNGKGFDTESQASQMGLGMRNIESRIRMIGAEQELQSSPGKGVFFQIKKHLS